MRQAHEATTCDGAGQCEDGKYPATRPGSIGFGRHRFWRSLPLGHLTQSGVGQRHTEASWVSALIASVESLPFTPGLRPPRGRQGQGENRLAIPDGGRPGAVDSSPDFEGHGLNPILEDGEIISYAGRRWLVRREPTNPSRTSAHRPTTERSDVDAGRPTERHGGLEEEGAPGLLTSFLVREFESEQETQRVPESDPSMCGEAPEKRGLSFRNGVSIAWAVTGSNRRPPRCKRGALPTELTARDSRH